jgi:hypothetical protein
MVWFKVDDGFYSDPKVMGVVRTARASAVGVWLLCGTWSAHKRTDGAIPAYMIDEVGGSEADAQALVTVGLWTKTKSGYLFRNWSDYQPTRDALEAASEAERKRKADYRARKAIDTGKSPAEVPEVSQRDKPGVPALSKHPVPVPVPVPILSTNPPTANAVAPPAKANRGTRIPEPFIVTAEMRSWAAKEVPGLDVDRATRSFVDYWRGATRSPTKLDWLATWRNSLRREFDRLPAVRRSAVPSNMEQHARNVVELQRMQDETRLEIGS